MSQVRGAAVAPPGAGRSRAHSAWSTLTRCFDAFLFSSAMAGGVAAALTLAAADALGVPRTIAARLAALACSGTLVVYTLDRLLDLDRDRGGWPERSAFVERHRAPLTAAAGCAAVTALALTAMLPPSVWGLCAAVLLLGLLHRRLKKRPEAKIGYVTLSWVAITAGLPAVMSSSPKAPLLAAVALVYLGAIAANLLASSPGVDREGRGRPILPATRLRWGRGLALFAAAVALAGPHPPLAAIPLAELAALSLFRNGERYLLAGVDGALLVGALACLGLSR